ncbi:hypothetical protein S83_051885, partial [Arachis hypogaea]
VAKCQEANPGVYTIITFPFLFAIMFGDWGHGICILLASLYFIIREKKYSSQKLGDIMQMAFGERYIIVMMAIFSIYTGFIYNEFFSIPFAIFAPSAYACRDPSCRWLSIEKQQFHCDDCGICRVGGQENYFHCEKCGSCYSVTLRDNHVCGELHRHVHY